MKSRSLSPISRARLTVDPGALSLSRAHAGRGEKKSRGAPLGVTNCAWGATQKEPARCRRYRPQNCRVESNHLLPFCPTRIESRENDRKNGSMSKDRIGLNLEEFGKMTAECIQVLLED